MDSQIKGKKYVVDDAQLMAEWDWEKNDKLGLDPNRIALNSHKKAWWICSKGHNYETVISSKHKGSKCIVCLNRKIVIGINDLATINPQLAQEWNYTLNGDLEPSMVAPSANKNVWWTCPNGHDYQATINHRSNGNGCPYCAGKRVLIGFNDLATQHPNLISDWDYDNNQKSPSEYTSHSNEKVFWKCNICGHGWITSITNRVNGTGCPECSKFIRGKKHTESIIKSKGSLKDNYPLIALEWHFEKNAPLLPEDAVSGSIQKVWWKCSKCGYDWIMSISKRISRGSGCPNCRNEKFSKNYREGLIKKNGSLIDTHPEIEKEWNYDKNNDLLPEEVTSTSAVRAWWQCSKGHEWQVSIDSRTRYKTGCPICSGRIAEIGVNDLCTTHPTIAAEWHPTKNGDLIPQQFKVGSNQQIWWKCAKGHEWKTTIQHRQQTGCPECAKETFTSFPEQTILFYVKNTFPDVINRYKTKNNIEIDIYLPSLSVGIEYDGAAYHNTQTGYAREQRKYQILKENNIYLIRIKEILVEKFCIDTADEYIGYSDNKSNKKLELILRDLQASISQIIGEKIEWDVNILRDREHIYKQYLQQERDNSIGALYPHLLDEWDWNKNTPITPYMVTKGSEKIFWWKCSKGHSFESKVNNRVKTGCPYCSNNKLLVGFNDLATRYPNLAIEWSVHKNKGLLPSQIIGGKQKVWWICSHGHEWQATIDSRKRGSGCPLCVQKKSKKDVT